MDYAVKTQYVITVVGKTDGKDIAASEVDVTINVLDRNDPPVMD